LVEEKNGTRLAPRAADTTRKVSIYRFSRFGVAPFVTDIF